MKKIVLKINNLNVSHERYGKLKYASFFTMESEVSGLMGLDSSGNELAVRILLGEPGIEWNSGNIYIDGRQIRDPKEGRKLVGHIVGGAPAVEHLTVAEYVGLNDVSWLLTIKAKKQLRRMVSEQFAQIGASLDIDKKMKELSELERRVVELVRARKKGVRVLIIEDECEGMNRKTIMEYRSFLRRAIEGKMTVLLLCHSEATASLLIDNYIIFRKGRIIKHGWGDFKDRHVDINHYLLGGSLILKKKSLDRYTRYISLDKDIVYGVQNIPIKGKREYFEFHKGEITTFVIINNAERLNFFEKLCGRNTPDYMEYLLDGQWVRQPVFSRFKKSRIVSIMKTGNDYELFEKMSVGDNLLIPSIEKIPRIEYFSSGGMITRVLSSEIENSSLDSDTVLKELNSNDHIAIAFNRWYVFNPKVIVLYEPFTFCDTYGVSIVASFIKKFSNRGTAVIVVKSSLEYMEDISDRIINY